MTRTVEFHRLEDYSRTSFTEDSGTVHVSFNTKQYGILQVEYSKEDGLQELKNEPDLYMFRDEDRKYIERACAIVWMMVWKTPAAKERFED